jgi:hypothetical protein
MIRLHAIGSARPRVPYSDFSTTLPPALRGIGNKVVVFSFPDEASFRDWAESTDYLEIAKDRKAAAKSVIVLVKGIASHGDVPKHFVSPKTYF